MSARIHLRNLAFNWGGHASSMLVLFFLSPYIVGKLDPVAYGIWSLLNVLTGYMGIFDLGVRASVGRHVALYLGKGDPQGVDETIRAGFGFFSLVGGLILLVGIVLGWFFPELFNGISPKYSEMVRILLPLMVIKIWFATIAAIYSSVLAAHDRFDIARSIDMFLLLVRTVGTIYVLAMGWGLWGLVFTVLIGNILAVILNRIFAGRVHKGLRSAPFLYSRERLRELFGYGIPAFITSSAIKIIGQSDLVLVGIFLSVSDVREYSVGAMLIYYFSRNLSIISRTLFPAIQRSAAQEKIGEVRHLLNRQMQISFSLGLVAFIGFYFYSEPFIHLWMFQDGFSESSVAISAKIMSILAISSIPLVYMRSLSSTLSALGHVGFTAKISILEAITNVLFSIVFVLVFDLGLYGIACGTLVARLIPAVGTPWYLYRKIGGLSRFLSKLIVPGAFCSGIFILVCHFSVKNFYPATWPSFFIQIALVSSVWLFLAYISFFKLNKRR